MRSAQRRARKEKSKVGNWKISSLIKILIPVLIVVFSFLYIKFTTKYWDARNKVSFVFQRASGDVAVIVLDPELSEETTLVIPGDTEVDVAHNYGTFRVKNVWQLGVNEKLRGSLLAQTVTNNFLFPTFLWAGKDMSNPWQFIFRPGLTNIPFGDRINMAIFSMRVKSIDATIIDLGKNQFLRKQTLTDGASGYVMNGPVSGRLSVYFSDNNFSDKNLKFGLIDVTGTYGVANSVGSILEVLGGKVVSIDRKPEQQDIDCKVYGKNPDAVRVTSVLFNCARTEGKSGFDLMMEMGGKFAKRF